jgi:formylglycine-generating enzyme required for sulfatase activity
LAKAVTADAVDVARERTMTLAAAPHLARIPAGDFLMGAADGEADERPVHRVHVSEFFIGRFSVTNDEYARFVRATGHPAPDVRVLPLIAAGGRDGLFKEFAAPYIWPDGEPPAGHGSHPVVLVSYDDALAYCAWLSTTLGRAVRLPTEAEWEKAARGSDGRKYPWGNDVPDSNRAHFRAGWNDFKPVGSLPKGASPFGMLDAAGNGWAWVSSAYLPYPYNANDGREDLTRDRARVTRAGGQDTAPDEITATHRGRQVSRNPRGGHHDISFRCAR